MRPLAIVDYGMGNLRSVEKAFERLGHAAQVTRDPERIATAPGVVLPGVGAFGACMANLTLLGLVEPVRHAIRSGRPFLGICLGMQLLFEESEEFGPVAGLGILPGRVVRFTADPARKVPHMGWNALRMVRAAPALAGIDDGAYVYFVHSYYPVAAICAAVRSPVQVGGGLRDGAAVESALAAGAARVVLGTVAVVDPERAAAICGAHPGRVAIGLDARDGRLRVAGWTEGAATTATAAAAAAAGLGAAAVIYTDIGRDGTERGPDLDGTRAVARAAGGVPVIASGGIGALDHVRAVAALGVAGVIIGRALYTGAVRLADALAVTEAA